MVHFEQGLANEYTGELQAVQRALGWVLTLLSRSQGLSLPQPASASPAQAAVSLPRQLPTQNGVRDCSSNSKRWCPALDAQALCTQRIHLL